MGMNGSDNGMLTVYSGGRSRREGQRERAESLRHFEKKETVRYREAIAGFGKEARDVRTRRKEQRVTAKQTCNANMTQTKERTKKKPPHRRRAEIAKTRVDCDFDVMNIEEQTAQALEELEGKREKEVSYRRSSRLSARQNRDRDKTRKVPPRVQRDEMLDRIRNDLDPDLLPYFEEQKGSPHFRKLLDGGRMTPTEAVLQMAHDDPEGVLAAFQRAAERELQGMLEQWEQEGGRVAHEQEHETRDPKEVAELGDERPRTYAQTAGKRKTKRGRKSKALEGGTAAPSNTQQPPKSGLTVHDLGNNETASIGVTRDGDEWLALSFAESKRFKTEGGAVRWLNKRGFNGDGTRMNKGEGKAYGPADARSEPVTSNARAAEQQPEHEVRETADRVEAPSTPELAAPSTEAEPEKACGCDVRRPEPENVAVPVKSSMETSGRRLSPEERTAWFPGTEPALAPSAAPVTPVRTTLFDDEADATPERAGATPQHDDKKKPGKDPFVQQAFGTDFTNWLNQAGPQLTLDSTPATAARRPALAELSVMPAHAEPAYAPAYRAPAASEPPAPTRTTPSESASEVGAPLQGIVQSLDPASEEGPPRYAAWRFADATLEEDRTTSTLQVWFEHMPPQKTRFDIRAAGFRWWAGIQRWQAPLDAARRRRAEEILRTYAEEKLAGRKGGASTAASSPAVGEPASEQAHGAPTGAEPSEEENDAADHAAENDEEDEDSAEGGPTPNTFEQKRTNRAARLRARADALQAASNAAYSQAHARADRIPFGQPILVGHHSEGRDRRFRDKIHKGFGKAFELQDKAKDLRRRADAAENSRAISSDDPDAIEKLRAKVEEKRAFIDQAKSINEVIRAARAKHKTGWETIARERLARLSIEPNRIDEAVTKGPFGHYGVPGFTLRNANGEITRLERRIESLQRRDARPVRAPETIGEATLLEDREANRVQIRFEGVPSKDVRSKLRGAGFVWAPSMGAWQRKLTEGAHWRALRLLHELYPDAKEMARKEAPPAEPPPMREPGEDDEQDAPVPEDADVGVPF